MYKNSIEILETNFRQDLRKFVGSSWFKHSVLPIVCLIYYNFANMGQNPENKELFLQLIENQFGRKPKTPNNFNELLLSIYAATGRSLSLSTVKRLWGYVKYQSLPSEATLTTLARYVGFRDWESFCNNKPDDDSYLLKRSNLPCMRPGATVTLEWDPEKGCTLRHIGSNRFVVTEAHNIKLLPGDELTADIFSTGQPIYFKDIFRDGQIIPLYIGAKKQGLKTIRFET